MMTVKDSSGSVLAIKTVVDGSEHVPVHAVHQSALPTGAATEATIASMQADIALIKADVADVLTAVGAVTTAVEAVGTELALKANLTDEQPVVVGSGTVVAKEATLNSVLSSVNLLAKKADVYPGDAADGENVASSTTDDSAVTVKAADTDEILYLHQLIVGNASTIDTWMEILSDTTVLGQVFVPQKSSQVIGFLKPLVCAQAEDLKIRCVTTGTDVKTISLVRVTIA